MRHTDEFVFVQQISEHHTRQLLAMYQKEWWTKGRELDEVEEMLRHSFVCAFLTKPDNDLAAFARVVTDRVFKALIFDVIVALPYRRCGLGQRLLQHIANDAVISKVRHLELYSASPESPSELSCAETVAGAPGAGGVKFSTAFCSFYARAHRGPICRSAIRHLDSLHSIGIQCMQ